MDNREFKGDEREGLKDSLILTFSDEILMLNYLRRRMSWVESKLCEFFMNKYPNSKFLWGNFQFSMGTYPIFPIFPKINDVSRNMSYF